MKFRFCGNLDCPDFLLKEIDTISKVSVVRIKLVVAQVVKSLVNGIPLDYAKIEKLLIKSNLTSSDTKGVVAGLDYILKNGVKYDVDAGTLSLELNQLGLPKEHCDAVCKGYQADKEVLRERLAERTLALPNLSSGNPVDWRVNAVLGSSLLGSAPDQLTASVQLRFNPASADQAPIAVELSSSKFLVFAKEMEEAKNQMETLIK